MTAEIEVRFATVAHEPMRQLLITHGAVCRSPMRLMRRAIMDFPDRRMQHGNSEFWGWIRVRDEGDRVTVTYKHIAKNEQFDTHEIELTVSSFDSAVGLFEAIGLKVLSLQESKRETWILNSCEIALDEWPWIEPFIEIEGPDEGALQNTAGLLELPWSEALKGNVVEIYRKRYKGMVGDDTIGDIPELTFEEMPAWLRERET